MKDNTKLIESLIEKVTDYGQTSYELVKLKAIDKISVVVSSFMSSMLILILSVSFMIFLNLGIALWLGDLFGKIYYGFFIVAAFYIFLGLVLHFKQKSFKRIIVNFIVKQTFNQIG